MLRPLVLSSCLALLATTAVPTNAGDWTRFRGPNGSGVSTDTAPLPETWSETENLRWKAELPGPGSSSPIIVGDKVFVTCWSGYGVDRNDPGNQNDLKRHLVCIDRTTGETLWDRTADAVLPEDRYSGMFAEHGYATHTPVSDGEAVYAFFGKSGVHAFDMEGKPLWNTGVGTELDNRRWGSSSSPILHGNLVIVPAVVENRALVALDKTTGKEVWKAEASGFASTWGSPVLVETEAGGTEIVMAVPGEFWAFNPENGKLKWFAETIGRDSICASAFAVDGIVYAVGGRNGAVAVKAGGEDDVSDSHVLWTTNPSARIGTALYHDGRIHWVNGGVANAIDAKTGERVYQARLEGAGGRDGGGGGGRFGGGGGRFGGGGGRGGGQDYSSIVAGDGKLYYASRGGDVYVLKAGPEFEQLAVNRFASDRSDYSATPAISDGDLFIRSSRTLYCVGLPRE